MKTPIISPRLSKPAPHLYFVNASVDFALIGGVSIVTFGVLALLSQVTHIEKAWALNLAAVLLWVCNWPHFAATVYRLYHSKANIAQYPVTAAGVPLLLMAGVVAAFAWPTEVAPFFVKLFLLWSPYHFSGQSVGISLIYARRAGFVMGRLERLSLSGFIFGTFILGTARGEIGSMPQPYYGIFAPTLGLPTYVVHATEIGMWVCAGAFLLLILRWCIVNRCILPPIVLLPGVTQFFWFVLGWRIPSFLEFVPFFHSLQYLLIAWTMQLKQKIDVHEIKPSKPYVLKETVRWGCIIFVGGVLQFWVLPRLGTLAGYNLLIAEPIMIAAVQLHHFFVDGVIWKLRNPNVSSPLLVNLKELMREAPEPILRPA